MTKLGFDAWFFVLTGVIDLDDLGACTSIRSMAIGRSAVRVLCFCHTLLGLQVPHVTLILDIVVR